MRALLVSFVASCCVVIALGYASPFDVLAALFIAALIWDYDVVSLVGPSDASAYRPSESNVAARRRITDQLALHSAQLTLREVAADSPKTLFQFVASCKLVRFDHMYDLFWANDVAKKVEDSEFRHVRRQLLRGMAKKLTHPLFGLTSNGSDKFRGTEIVDWLCANFDMRSRARGVDFGRLLHAVGILKPLRRNMTELTGARKSVRFGDKMRYWSFNYEAIDPSWPEERELLLRSKHASSLILSATGGPSSADVATPADGTAAVLAPGGEVVAMGSREWQYLFQAAGKVDTFPDNHTIIEYGCPNDYLYRVVKGQARVTGVPSTEQVTRIRAYLVEENIFGEETACGLGEEISPVAVCADGGPITVQSVDSATLSKLLKIEPLFAKAFWKWLACSLAVRLLRMMRVEPGVPTIALPPRERTSSLDASASTLTSSQTTMATARRSTRWTVKDALPRTVSLKYDFPELVPSGASAVAAPSATSNNLASVDSPMPSPKLSERKPKALLEKLLSGPSKRESWEIATLRNSSPTDVSAGPAAAGAAAMAPEDAAVLIKQFSVKWLGLKKATMYVTQNGIGLMSGFYKRKQSIMFGSVEGFEVNATKLQILVRSTVVVGRSRKIRKRETSIIFQKESDMTTALSLMEHFHAAAAASASGAAASASSSFSSSSSSSSSGLSERESFADHDLTAEDWSFLMEGSRQSVFPDKQTILVGSDVPVLHQIVSGSVRVVSTRTHAVMTTLGEGDFVGAAEFVSSCVNVSSVQGEVTYVTDGVVETVGFVVEVLRLLFVNKPAICARFHRFVSLSLNAQIRDLSSRMEQQLQQASGTSMDATQFASLPSPQ